jgi:L-threonylcarbamoyladenylate synthase
MDDKLIEVAVGILKNGGLVIYPTETCYGVGALANNKEAVEKLLKYKRRPEGKAISIAVADQNMAEEYVDLNDEAKKIYKEFLPGPVTVISKSKGRVIKELEAEDGTLGVRIPDFALITELIQKVGAPITATSANSAGKKTPYKVEDIYENITLKQKELIDYVIDFGELPHNPPSTVINTTRHDLQVIRKGEVSLGKVEYKVEVDSPEKMVEEGSRFMKKYKNLLHDNCVLVMFNAELGAGKTQFVKGMAKALEIDEIIKSPTYSLLKEYKYHYEGNDGMLAHFDAWRIENLGELDGLGLEGYIGDGNVIAVEWAGATEEYFERISHKESLYTINVKIDYISENKRLLMIYESK